MRKNIVLVDYESVQPATVDELGPDHFELWIFAGANQKIPVPLAAATQPLGSRVRYIHMAGTGPNALDFHIAYYIGKLATSEPDLFFHIISKDKGFDPLVKHLKEQKIYCVRSEAIQDIPIIRQAAEQTTQKTVAQLSACYMDKLRQPKSTKPRSVATLTNSIKAHFREAANPADIPAIIAAMQAEKFLAITDGKVSYAKI